MIYAGLSAAFFMLAIGRKLSKRGPLTTIQALLFGMTNLWMLVFQMRSLPPVYVVRYFLYIVSSFLILAVPVVFLMIAYFIYDREMKRPTRTWRFVSNILILSLLVCFLLFTLYNVINIRAVYLPMIISLYSALAVLMTTHFLSYIFLTFWVNLRQWRLDKATVIVILGSDIDDDGQIQVDLRKRLDRGLKVYKQLSPLFQEETYFILTGGNPTADGKTEAEAMFQYLEKRGIPTKSLIKEPSARNTKENMAFILPFIRHLGLGKQLVIVTNHYHSLRARYFAEKAGISAYFAAASNTWISWPYSAAREYIALLMINKEWMIILMAIVAFYEWARFN
ncbi:TPA: YdcF family protein [Streptococcus suis]